MKENDRKQDLTAENSREIDRQRAAAAQSKKGVEIVLNTEQCHGLNRVRARKRRWNNTEQCRESGRVRALEKNWNTRKNWLRRLQNFARRDMIRSRASQRSVACQQEKSKVFCVVRGITGRWAQREKVVNSLIFRKDLFSSVFATFAGSSGDRIHTEANCQIVVSDFFNIELKFCLNNANYPVASVRWPKRLTVQLWFLTVQLWFLKRFSCDFSQFSRDFWNSSVVIFDSSVMIFETVQLWFLTTQLWFL